MLDGLSCGDRLSRDIFESIEERAVLEAFKWNIADRGTRKLCDFPLLLERGLWHTLSEWAVRLGAEADRAESELLGRPFLRARLGIPWRLQRALPRCATIPPLRYARFDFHPTEEGYFAITEGNLDVAGGWNEAGGVAALFAECMPAAECAGNPATALARCLVQRLGAGAVVGVLHLTRYTDDHQVARFLARAFELQGLRVVLLDPTQLRAAGRRAGALVGERIHLLDAVFRFFPAEWSCRLPGSREWFRAAAKPDTLWVNPLSTVLTQSKRFPRTWRHLRATLPTWSHLLPETRNPLFVRGSEWVVKPTMGHEGYRVGIAGTTEPARMRALWRAARWRPWRWAAQRRFRPKPILTPQGPMYPCIGVYVIDGKPAGLYGRLSERPLIDDGARDIVVLVQR